MQITIDRALGWLLCLEVAAMLLVTISYYYAHGAVTTANIEIIKRSNGLLTQQESSSARYIALLTQWEAATEEQKELMERAKKLLKRFEDASGGSTPV